MELRMSRGLPVTRSIEDTQKKDDLTRSPPPKYLDNVKDMVLLRKSFKASDWERTVAGLVLSGLPVAEDPKSVLHWRVKLSLDDGRSIMLDMTPCGAGNLDIMLGILVIECRNANFSAEQPISIFSADTLFKPTVRTVINLLQGFQRHHYKFDETGSGCRYWCSVVIGDLERCRIIPDGTLERFENVVVELAKSNPDRFPMPVRKGTFY